jgi:hypothetical protein
VLPVTPRGKKTAVSAARPMGKPTRCRDLDQADFEDRLSFGMTTPTAADPRYPVGKFKKPDAYTDASRKAAIAEIAALPANLRKAVAGLSDAQLDTPYREGGWTIRQVVHHLADSHMNAYIRQRFTLTEEKPTVKPYDENVWANLPESRRLVAIDPRRRACPLGGAAEFAKSRGLQPRLCAPRVRRAPSGLERGDVRVALPASCRAHHVCSQEQQLLVARHALPVSRRSRTTRGSAVLLLPATGGGQRATRPCSGS